MSEGIAALRAPPQASQYRAFAIPKWEFKLRLAYCLYIHFRLRLYFAYYQKRRAKTRRTVETLRLLAVAAGLAHCVPRAAAD